MIRTLLAFMFFAPALASNEEDWVPPSHFEPQWNKALAAAMPGHSVSGCGVVNSMAARDVISQCQWRFEGAPVGWMTVSPDSSVLCAWGERPEAPVDDFAFDLDTGSLRESGRAPPCPAPVWFEPGSL